MRDTRRTLDLGRVWAMKIHSTHLPTARRAGLSHAIDDDHRWGDSPAGGMARRRPTEKPQRRFHLR